MLNRQTSMRLYFYRPLPNGGMEEISDHPLNGVPFGGLGGLVKDAKGRSEVRGMPLTDAVYPAYKWTSRKAGRPSKITASDFGQTVIVKWWGPQGEDEWRWLYMKRAA